MFFFFARTKENHVNSRAVQTRLWNQNVRENLHFKCEVPISRYDLCKIHRANWKSLQRCSNNNVVLIDDYLPRDWFSMWLMSFE